MARNIFSVHRDRWSFVAPAIAVTVLLGGVGLIGTALTSQRSAAQPFPVANVLSGTIQAADVPVVATFASTSDSLPAVIGPTMSRSKPVALNIPSIGVRSDIQYLGQTDDGALDTPAPGPLYDTAAWYRYSPTPGSLGPAILYGHVDSAANGPSVFFRLGELTRGDRVTVTRADGSIAVFEVDSVERYAKDNFPTKVVYSNIDHAGLRILTCGGAFDDATGHYLDNIVVFASLVGSSKT